MYQGGGPGRVDSGSRQGLRESQAARCQIEPNKECVRKRLKPSIGSYRRWQSDWHTRALKGCSECCVPKSALSPANTCF